MKNKFLVLVFLVLVINFVWAGEIDEQILNAFDKNDEVRIIVDTHNTQDSFRVAFAKNDFVVDKIVERNNKFVTKVDLKELGKLGEIYGNENIRLDYPLRIFLQDSVKIIQANDSWKLQSLGVNLTGVGQSVCILDTGIDTNHPDLQNKIIAEKCYCSVSDSGSGGCCLDGTSEDDFAEDDHGHGTHVAGIVGASGKIFGVATGVNFVVVKMMNASGSGNGVDLEDGMQWCIDNSDEYNISVITASLGTDAIFSSNCDSSFSSLKSIVDEAVDKNISVLFASGNAGSTTGISAPACISSVIPVSSVDKSNEIASSANRNSLIKLFGIGVNINSTYYNGQYHTEGGTSMATPMVAGAISIINQYLNLSGQYMTSSGVEDLFYNTGKRIDDTAGSGYNFTRINVYNALLSIDMDSPEVYLVSPENESTYVLGNQTFVCNASDWQLKNITFRIWNSSELYYNESKNINGTFNESSFELTEIPDGEYVWSCESYDNLTNFGVSSNFTISIGSVEVSQNYPLDNSYTNVNLTEFNCSATTDSSLNLFNLTFYLWNSSDVLIYNETNNISGNNNSSSFLYNLSSDGEYVWECEAFNNESSSAGTFNFTLNYDSIEPEISNLTNEAGTTTASLTWTTDEETNYSISGNLTGTNSSYTNNHSVAFSGLGSSTTYSYLVVVCDKAGNCVNESSSFTTDATLPSSSGGGGSSNSPKVYRVNEYQLRAGVTKELKKNDEISFSLVSGNHKFKVTKIDDNFASIEIRSEPVYLTMNIGEEIKLNLSSPDFYDLYVKLNFVDDNEANFTVKRIYEKIIIEKPKPVVEENKSEEKIYYIMNESEEIVDVENSRINPFDYPVVFVVVGVLLFYIILKQMLSYNKHRKTVKHYKVGRTKKNKHHSKRKVLVYKKKR